MTQSGHGQDGQSWGQPSGRPWGPPPPHPGAYGASGRPLPPEAPPGHAAPGQAMPPGAPAGDAATQYLRPVPPETPAESTAFLGTGFGTQPPQPAQAQHGQYEPPQHPQQPQHGQYPQQPRSAHPDSEATQYIPPVAGRSGPPAEFDNLFRDDAAGATQQMPRLDATPPAAAQQRHGYGYPPPQPYGHQQPYGQQPPAAAYQQQPAYDDGYDEPAPRRSSKLPLVAAVVIGCAVVGLGAGALLSGGDGEEKGKGDTTGIAAASSPTPSAPAQPPADPAKAQAEELDKLLADSGSSRATVISSVENIKRCSELDKAASDLRAAAQQRRGLVTRLQAIKVDKLPSHTELTAALTKAWQASAEADDHYAAWAEQVKGRKGCKDGRARYTGRTAQAGVASGEATTAKQQAARLWNGIAETHGLTKRQPTQL
ncbi:hypothetical protein ACFPM3_22705 [Streptomyces coeruleoprunus]|uniref:Uncharacterized protein n=1 Tax=Streptomyces coeruleoprunus TaxID=285563 RepID=A0ABV9XIU7_9ACTN